jgi:transcriptional regulator with XRE-family HTH domain
MSPFPPAAILVQFGKAVRERREKLQLSQQTAAESAGISITYLGKVERAQVNVSLGNVEKISRALKCHPADLLRHYEAPVLLQHAAMTIEEPRKKKKH